MLISEASKLLFIHIQKTGGSSIARMLRRDIPDATTYLGTHDHASWAKEALGSRYDEFFKFAFVRNPWDRLVSWYSMIRQESKGQPRAELNLLWKYVLDNSSSFDDFLLNCTETIDDEDGKKSVLYAQLDYISDESGALIVDFVGRYEDFARDLRHVLRRVDLSDAEIPHENRSRHVHYSAYYTPRTRDIVAERYEKDIKAFGYTFETPNTEDGPRRAPPDPAPTRTAQTEEDTCA
jgi:hypothetical protein